MIGSEEAYRLEVDEKQPYELTDALRHQDGAPVANGGSGHTRRAAGHRDPGLDIDIVATNHRKTKAVADGLLVSSLPVLGGTEKHHWGGVNLKDGEAVVFESSKGERRVWLQASARGPQRLVHDAARLGDALRDWSQFAGLLLQGRRDIAKVIHRSGDRGVVPPGALFRTAVAEREPGAADLDAGSTKS